MLKRLTFVFILGLFAFKVTPTGFTLNNDEKLNGRVKTLIEIRSTIKTDSTASDTAITTTRFTQQGNKLNVNFKSIRHLGPGVEVRDKDNNIVAVGPARRVNSNSETSLIIFKTKAKMIESKGGNRFESLFDRKGLIYQRDHYQPDQKNMHHFPFDKGASHRKGLMLLSRELFIYDDQDRLVKIQEYHDKDSLYTAFEYTWTNNGQLSKKTEYERSGKIFTDILFSDFEFDKKGNWIKRTEITTDIQVEDLTSVTKQIVTRTFKYY